MPSVAASRSAAVAAALALALLAAGGWTVRARRSAWRARAERLCACSAETVARLRRTGDALPMELGDAMRAQARILDASCGDLRRAARAQGLGDALRDRPLRVAPTTEHDRARDAARAALRRLCDPERDAVWTRRREREPGGSVWSPEIVRAAAEARRLREALCARQAALTAVPEPYTLTAAQGDEEARTCGAR